MLVPRGRVRSSYEVARVTMKSFVMLVTTDAKAETTTGFPTKVELITVTGDGGHGPPYSLAGSFPCLGQAPPAV